VAIEISSECPTLVPDAVCFETGATRKQVADPSLWVYEHHGEDFGWADPGALTCFYDDLIHGRPMPPNFASSGLRDVDVLVALALHKNPNLVLCPNALKIVTSADLVHRRGAVGMAHADPDLTQFFRFLRNFCPKASTKKEIAPKLIRDALEQVVFIEDYIANDRIPQMAAEPEPPTVLDTGSRGFVVAETSGSLGEAWVHLFRSGYQRGVVFGKDKNGRRYVVGARKGLYVDFNLPMAARLLNEVERAMGEALEWQHDALWLYGPAEGSAMVVSHILEILVRV
jgi:hypothetical protein